MNDIERLIADLGETPAGLARRLGVSEASISRWRSGTHRPSGLYAERVAELKRHVALSKPVGPGATGYEQGYRQGWRDAVAALTAAALAAESPIHQHHTEGLNDERERRQLLP